MLDTFFEIARFVAYSGLLPEEWTHLDAKKRREIRRYLSFLENELKLVSVLQNCNGPIWSLRNMLLHIKQSRQFPLDVGEEQARSYSDKISIDNFNCALNHIYSLERNINRMVY